MADDFSIALRIFSWLVPVIYAITLHEVAHGVVSYYLGDSTAMHAGRLSLNPLKHIDVIGSIVVPVFLFWSSGFVFGWAKAVPVNEKNLGSARRDMVLVAAAGPVANLLMSMFWAIIMKLGYLLSASRPDFGVLLVYMGAAGVFINAAIMMLNLLPLPPLDGGRILAGLLPQRYGRMLSRVEPWGFVILVVAIVTGLVAKIIWPMMVPGMAAITYLVDTPGGLFIQALRFLFAEP